jgi:hypothetical protein
MIARSSYFDFNPSKLDAIRSIAGGNKNIKWWSRTVGIAEEVLIEGAKEYKRYNKVHALHVERLRELNPREI